MPSLALRSLILAKNHFGKKKSGPAGRFHQRGEGGRKISQGRRCKMKSWLTPRHTDWRSLKAWKRV